MCSLFFSSLLPLQRKVLLRVSFICQAALAGGVGQTRRDSIDRGLFAESSSEQDQLNIYYGRSMAAGELSNELDISLASASGPPLGPLMTF